MNKLYLKFDLPVLNYVSMFAVDTGVVLSCLLHHQAQHDTLPFKTNKKQK